MIWRQLDPRITGIVLSSCKQRKSSRFRRVFGSKPWVVPERILVSIIMSLRELHNSN